MKHFFLLLCLCTLSVSAQKTADSLSASRLFNIGLKAGPAVEFAQASENSLGIYASDHGLFELRSYDLALDAQLYQLNGIGAALEAGFRKNQGDFAPHQHSRIFRGEGYNGFSRRSVYLKPSFLYNRMLGERWLLMTLAGAEFHKNLDSGTRYLYGHNYRYASPQYYTNLSGGLEVKTWLNQSLGLSFYANYLYGLNTTAEVYRVAEDESGDYIKLGEYNGTGLDLGFRVSLCLSCRN